MSSYSIDLPRLRALRLSIGGVLGLLPILGFWMWPLGMLVLATDLPLVHRLNRTIKRWWI
jgi:hypothetical protein